MRSQPRRDVVMCCTALLCANAQRTLADAILVRLPQARIENMCAL
jgi:hypothetical protein